MDIKFFTLKQLQDMEEKKIDFAFQQVPKRGNTYGVAIKQVVHTGVGCDQCKIRPIKGIRYKCSVCPDYDNCSACEAKAIHDPSHPMLKMTQPEEPKVRWSPWDNTVFVPDIGTVPQWDGFSAGGDNGRMFDRPDRVQWNPDLDL
jgi:hypothetical protein